MKSIKKIFILLSFVLIISLESESSEIQKKIPVFREPIVTETDAFSMIGDSRTQFIYNFGVNNDWDSLDYLGQYRTTCSGEKTTIQNAGIGGTTTTDWLNMIETGIVKPEIFHKRIVILLGGNDILQESISWHKQLSNSSELKELMLDSIHGRFVKIINILLSWDKEIIIQTHFLTNPKKKTWFYKSADDSLVGLNMRLMDTYGEDSSGKPKVDNVSLSIIEPNFPAILFLDKVHLNAIGFRAHAFYLKTEITKRCWW